MSMLFPQVPPPPSDDGLAFDPSHPHYASVPLVRLTAAGESGELVTERGALAEHVDQFWLRRVIEESELVGVTVGVLANEFGDLNLDVVALGGAVEFDHRYTYDLVKLTAFRPQEPTGPDVIEALEAMSAVASRAAEMVGEVLAAGWAVTNAGLNDDGNVVVRFTKATFTP